MIWKRLKHEDALITLVPRVVDLVGDQDIPVIAAGGIVDACGYVAALALGAEFVSALGFPIDGKPVTGVDPVEEREVCERLLGKSEGALTSKSKNILLAWLKTNFEVVEEELEVDGEPFARYIEWRPYQRFDDEDFLPPALQQQVALGKSRTVMVSFEKTIYHRPDLCPR
ncbi:hypothetical protein Droror1_Dr00023211 [Drosera rotundifolia]